VADGDDDRRAFKLVSALVGLGSVLYLVPTLLGVQLASAKLGPAWTSLARALSTNTDPGLAVALCWVGIAATGLMGLVALWYDLTARQPSRRRSVGRLRLGSRRGSDVAE
jgi:hypothetical protein